MVRKSLQHLRKDPHLAEIIRTTKLPKISRPSDVYDSLLRTIIYQQLSGKAAGTIHGRFIDLFDGTPKPELVADVATQDLRDAGLSGQKSRYVKNVAEFWIDERPNASTWKSLSDEEVIDYLTRITGVGVWSAQMILMFTLNRPDVFPANDLGIRNAIVKKFRLRVKGRKLNARLDAIAEPWRPYRTLACRYLWAWLDS